ncbi:unnamed protein product [Gongylonema pulchrum]|uniref:Uncharacterized protein n=1 Tax=Gongylonema pulchrum TaxID=637853 RepID=A0A3P7NV07_9BILA|nr:unnamed protein product [Gongylonema pulchrum]
MNSTVLVIMGDHGNRIHDIQRPMLAELRSGPRYSLVFKTAKFIVRHNLRLTSNYNVHQTLKDIAWAEFRHNRPYRDRKGCSYLQYAKAKVSVKISF